MSTLTKSAMNLANATISQLLIPVDDFDRRVEFYRDTLEIPLLFAASPQMAFFNCGGIRLLVGVTPPGQKAQRGSALYFRVPDIQAVYSSLKDNYAPDTGHSQAAPPHLASRHP